ncbi:tigger transposable element-derived protein 7 isoform X2 [Phascolarctos cinereus]|uniref:Tigger transposable element-derived protein 7 isoform X2 n=1 Tax=Phascolarctos cinereus TaxID=38626 RepID=A0A6P5L320_PHACI|nr:tigger transposable element-derived protein 7 isoform X2 [Phascolarctos cinereus]
MPLITGSRPDPSGVPETSRHVVLGLLPGSTGFCVPFLRRSAVGFLDSSPLGGRLRGPGSRSEGFLWRARRLSWSKAFTLLPRISSGASGFGSFLHLLKKGKRPQLQGTRQVTTAVASVGAVAKLHLHRGCFLG